MSLAPRVLVHSSNFDLERELLTEELKAEREPPVPIEVTEIKQWYAMKTEARRMVVPREAIWRAVILPKAQTSGFLALQ